MPEVDGQEKTEQPTGRRISKSRAEGQVAKSMEINSLAIFSAGFMLLFFTQGYLGKQLSELARTVFNSLDRAEINTDLFQLFMYKGAIYLLITLGPILLGLVIVAIIAGYGQVGFKITPKSLIPKMSLLNPAKGLKKIGFSVRSYVELLKSILKLVILGLVSYWILKDVIMESVGLVNYPVDEAVNFINDSTIALIWKLTLIYAVFAALDLIYQKYEHKKNLMMTKQEVKEEVKQTEGDPLIKSKIKGKQFEIARRRMMAEVPKADVVITNPTHYAVALKYSMKKDAAPRIVAKGVDRIAQKIKQIAMEHNVHIYEDRELARTLYSNCEIGEIIPSHLYKAVAQVLAYVYQLKNLKKRKSII